jgi:hypothetical protein
MAGESAEESWLDRILNGAGKVADKYIDWERMQAETSIATRAAAQNLDARGASIEAAKASNATQNWLILGGVAVLALVLLKKL